MAALISSIVGSLKSTLVGIIVGANDDTIFVPPTFPTFSADNSTLKADSTAYTVDRY